MTTQKIGILGSGTVAQTLGTGLLAVGHKVKLGTRDTSKLEAWLKDVTNVNASVGSFADAASFGEVVILATLGVATASAIELAGKRNFTGKIVIDTTNPLDFSKGVPPTFAAELGNSLGEQIQRWIPDSKVVKAFNSIGAHIMVNPKREEGTPDLVALSYDRLESHRSCG